MNCDMRRPSRRLALSLPALPRLPCGCTGRLLRFLCLLLVREGRCLVQLRLILSGVAVPCLAPIQNAEPELGQVQQVRFGRPRTRTTDRLPERTPVREERN